MKREDFLIGAGIYALVIAAGYSGPILKKLEKLPWGQPVEFFTLGNFNPTMPTSVQKVKKKPVCFEG